MVPRAPTMILALSTSYSIVLSVLGQSLSIYRDSPRCLWVSKILCTILDRIGWSSFISISQRVFCLVFQNILCLFFASWWYLHFLVLFHWSLSDSKFPCVFRTFLSILSDFNNARSLNCLKYSSTLLFTQYFISGSWEFFQDHPLQFISTSTSCIATFSISSKVQVFIQFSLSFIFTVLSVVQVKSTRQVHIN